MREDLKVSLNSANLGEAIGVVRFELRRQRRDLTLGTYDIHLRLDRTNGSEMGFELLLIGFAKTSFERAYVALEKVDDALSLFKISSNLFGGFTGVGEDTGEHLPRVLTWEFRKIEARIGNAAERFLAYDANSEFEALEFAAFAKSFG